MCVAQGDEGRTTAVVLVWDGTRLVPCGDSSPLCNEQLTPKVDENGYASADITKHDTYIRIDGEDGGKTGTIVNCKTQVNIRAKASSNAKIIGKAKNGETFDVLGKSGNWYKIDYHGKTAYVFHRYIKVS